MAAFSDVKALTFDIYGTVLDLTGSLTPTIDDFLTSQGAKVSTERFWGDWRARQRLEQFQDTIMMVGHSGYLETARRACVYTLRLHGFDGSAQEQEALMRGWDRLSPFPDVVPALQRLQSSYKLVALSNGEARSLDQTIQNRIRFEFATALSVDMVGRFKPHPSVYRRAATLLGLEVGQCMMVSSHAFDAAGARACGFKAAYVNRYKLPFDDTPYLPQLTVGNFTELVAALL
jgi:2-haloacid dehalogenase